MAKREIDPRLQALYDKGASVYSYSKLSTIHDCPYGSYLTYIQKSPQGQNVYSYLGGITHDVLEDIIEGKAELSDIKPTLEKGLDELDMLGINFPKTRDGGTGIRDRWVANMITCLGRDYTSPKGKFEVEKLLILKINEMRYLQGYADLIRVLDDGSVQVLDLKTSSQFQEKDLLHYGRQLVAYAMALEQAGIKVRGVAWIMLKYVKVSYMAKRRKTDKEMQLISKVCDRCKLAMTIKAVARAKMYDAGYSEDQIDDIIERFLITNDIKDLPDEISSQFDVKTYVRPYDITDEKRQECLDFINETADQFEEMQQTRNWPHKPVTDKYGQADFFCTNLCGHRKNCPYLKEVMDLTGGFNKSKKCGLDELF